VKGWLGNGNIGVNTNQTIKISDFIYLAIQLSTRNMLQVLGIKDV